MFQAGQTSSGLVLSLSPRRFPLESTGRIVLVASGIKLGLVFPAVDDLRVELNEIK